MGKLCFLTIRLYILLAFCFPDFVFAQGALTIKSGGQLNIQPGGNLVIGGDVILRNGAGLINNGAIHVTNTIKSHWSDSTLNSGSVSGLGSIFFEGPNTISFSGATGFNNVIINGSNLQLDTGSTLKILNQLLLKKGLINATRAALVLNSSAPGAIKADTENPGYIKSYISGELQRAIFSNTSSYDFPVGDTLGVHLMRFLNNELVGSNYLTASFKPKPGTDEGLNVYEDGSYTSINNAGVWDLKADIAPTAGNYGLQLLTNGFSLLSDNEFGILARPGNSTKGSDWMVPQGSMMLPPGSSGRTLSDGFAQRNLITNFTNSQLGIGIISKALPISLTGFQAKRIDNSLVYLNWKTVSENNNRGFQIERRQADGNLFSIIGWVPSKSVGVISNTALTYTYVDTNAVSTSSYYRLRQTDYNGLEKISETIMVTGHRLLNKLYPNPTKGIVYVDLPTIKTYAAVIANVNGRIVQSITNLQTNKIDLSTFANGIYTITIMDVQKNVLLRKKLILQK